MAQYIPKLKSVRAARVPDPPSYRIESYEDPVTHARRLASEAKRFGNASTGPKSGAQSDESGAAQSKGFWRRVAHAIDETAEKWSTQVRDFSDRYSVRIESVGVLAAHAQSVASGLEQIANAKSPRVRALHAVGMLGHSPKLVISSLIAVRNIILNEALDDSRYVEKTWVDAQGRVYDPHMDIRQVQQMLGFSVIVPTWLLSFMGLSRHTQWSIVPPVDDRHAFGRPMPTLLGWDSFGAKKTNDKNTDSKDSNLPSYMQYQGFLTANLSLPLGAPVQLFWNRGNDRWVNPDFARQEVGYDPRTQTEIYMTQEDHARFQAAVFHKFWGSHLGVTVETGHVRHWTLDLNNIIETNALTELREHMAILDSVPGRESSRTVLLNGLPGAGKSYAAKVCAAARGWRALAYEANAFMQAISYDFDVGSDFADNGDMDSLLAKMPPTKLISMVRPDVLIIDDVERIEDTGLLLDTLAAIKRAGVRWVVLTTNAITKLDPAIVRPGRVDTIIEVEGLSVGALMSICRETLSASPKLLRETLGYVERLKGWPYSYVTEFLVMCQGYQNPGKAYRIMSPRVYGALKVYSETRLWQPTGDTAGEDTDDVDETQVTLGDKCTPATVDPTYRKVIDDTPVGPQFIGVGDIGLVFTAHFDADGLSLAIDLPRQVDSVADRDSIVLEAFRTWLLYRTSISGEALDAIQSVRHNLRDEGSPGILGLGERPLRVVIPRIVIERLIGKLPTEDGKLSAEVASDEDSDVFDLTELEDGTEVAE